MNASLSPADSPTETHLGMWEVLGKEGFKLISVHECPQRSHALRCRRRLPVLQLLLPPIAAALCNVHSAKS